MLVEKREQQTEIEFVMIDNLVPQKSPVAKNKTTYRFFIYQ